MGYSEVADVRNALSEDGADTGTGTAADMSAESIQDAIAEADAVIDGHVGGTYDPGTQPQIVHFWSRDMAAYLATLTNRKSQDIAADDPVRLRMALAMQGLNAVDTGKITLPLPPVQTVEGEAHVENQYTGKAFQVSDFDVDGGGVRSALRRRIPWWVDGSNGPHTWE